MTFKVKLCECGNKTLALVEDSYDGSYRIECSTCHKRTLPQDSISETIRAWNRGEYESDGECILIIANEDRELKN